jgi:hypothetical protein
VVYDEKLPFFVSLVGVFLVVEEGIIAVGHLYRAKTRAVQMCTHLYCGGSDCEVGTFIPGRATTRYKCEAFIPGGFCEGTFVSGGGSV